jgi:hypothetical protein
MWQKEQRKEYVWQKTQRKDLIRSQQHMSHHHTYYVTSSYIQRSQQHKDLSQVHGRALILAYTIAY